MNRFEKYIGNDNYGKPKVAYIDKIKALDEAGLLEETEQKIWLSAYAANNARSDYHWQVDACYDVILERYDGKDDLYVKAFAQAFPGR